MPDQEILIIAFPKQTKDKIYSPEMASLLDFSSDFSRQVTACSSASHRSWKGADLKIIRSSFTRFQEMIEQFAKDPEQYFPNSDDTPINVANAPTLKQPENPGALIITRQLAKIWGQIRNGDSAKMTSGFHKKELEYSILPGVKKLGDYIAVEELRHEAGDPIYMPEVNDQERDETTKGDPDNQDDS